MDGHRVFRVLSVVAFLATYVTMLLGGNVMASNSGLACPDWPTCHGALFASLTGHVGIEWSHRLSAFVLSFLVGALAIIGLLVEFRRPVLRNLALASLATVIGQALLGGLVVQSELVAGIVLAHFLLATVLFALLLLLTILANLREIPKGWVEWAWRASDELPGESEPLSGLPGAAREGAPGIAGATPATLGR